MATLDESGEKEHEASGKRLAKLSEQGNVMRSKDFSGGLLFFVGLMILMFMSTSFKDRLEKNFFISFGGIKNVLDDNFNVTGFLASLIWVNFKLILPIFFFMMVTVICTPMLFGGWNFTIQPIKFNLNKLNPLNNIKNIFGFSRVIPEVIKSTLKAFIIMGVLFYFVFSNKNHIISLINYTPETAAIECYSVMTDFAFLLSYTIIFISSVDMAYTWFTYKSQTKMSTQELKDEAKEQEGTGLAKKRMHSMKMARLRHRISQTVPKANVVIVNPTHYSVAIRYDREKDNAPKLLAKGKGPIAQQIRTLAIANGIPIYEAPSLARAIFFTTKINHEIHPNLYMAVAIVLSYVHQLKNYQMGIGQLPNFVRDFEIPKEFIYDEE